MNLPELAVIEKALEIVEDSPDVALHMVKHTQVAIDLELSDILWAMYKEDSYDSKEIKSYLVEMQQYFSAINAGH